MAPKSRSRMISFRLTDEEYFRFRHLCLSRGLRNVSELVRAAVNHITTVTHPGQVLTAPEMHIRLAALETRLADLASSVAQIENRFAAPRNSVNSDEAAGGN